MRNPASRLLLLVGLLACESTSSPVPVFRHDVTPEMVTGAALAALKPDGHFRITQPPTTSGEVSLEEARTQAPEFLKYLSTLPGDSSDFGLLTVCGEAYYVYPQLQVTIPDSVSAFVAKTLRRLYGAQWIIQMCGPDADLRMTVQTAIEGNDVRFANGERSDSTAALITAWTTREGLENWPDALTISAERAVRFVWETLGVRVTQVPQLFQRGDRWPGDRYLLNRVGAARSCHRWRIELENEVRVRGMTSLAEVTTKVIHVGTTTCDEWNVEPLLQIPSGTQLTEVLLDFLENFETPPILWTVRVPVLGPISFEFAVRAP
jgi:hypothetical protein